MSMQPDLVQFLDFLISLVHIEGNIIGKSEDESGVVTEIEFEKYNTLSTE